MDDNPAPIRAPDAQGDWFKMSLYLINYDLHEKPWDVYTKLGDFIKSWGGVEVLFSQWIIKTDSTAIGIRDALRNGYIADDDRLLVVQFYNIANGWASYNSMVDISKL
jgi:hypothetical protein